MKVTVYTKPACVQCNATKRSLKKAGVAYAEVDMTQDAEALAAVKAMGFKQAPVVVANGRSWSGYRPDELKALIKAVAEESTQAEEPASVLA